MKINIKKLASLANIPLDENQEKKLEGELEQTLAHVATLNEIDTSKVQGTNEVTDATNVMRDDTVIPSLSQEEALKNAKNTHNGFFIVPVIIAEAIE